MLKWLPLPGTSILISGSQGGFYTWNFPFNTFLLIFHSLLSRPLTVICVHWFFGRVWWYWKISVYKNIQYLFFTVVEIAEAKHKCGSVHMGIKAWEAEERAARDVLVAENCEYMDYIINSHFGGVDVMGDTVPNDKEIQDYINEVRPEIKWLIILDKRTKKPNARKVRDRYQWVTNLLIFCFQDH